ncbi:hypothetical protein [Pectobacterium actinidiae]|uniref:hypothetical protein n=1 Tax=Pectobacterium actinidiae TaxID=1507808 RepID=UPI0020852477|nr:hypothetical protein SOASR014_39570 [Pectobacterium carotovorum subsp. carotovorum]GLX43823.1 hypothetical protein Pcaca01_14910 [Pectobacterium carotovorum subsp. carotovorum]
MSKLILVKIHGVKNLLDTDISEKENPIYIIFDLDTMSVVGEYHESLSSAECACTNKKIRENMLTYYLKVKKENIYSESDFIDETEKTTNKIINDIIKAIIEYFIEVLNEKYKPSPLKM